MRRSREVTSDEQQVEATPGYAEFTRLSPRDLIFEAVNALLSRPQRSMLTVLGSVLGIGSFVAVLGLTLTTSGQISSRFTALLASEVTVSVAPERATAGGLPPDAEERTNSLRGVRTSGVTWPIQIPSGGGVSGLPPGASTRFDPSEPIPVVAASPGMLVAAHTMWKSGLGFATVYDDRAERVAILGEGAARRLGVDRLDAQPAVFIDGIAFTVVGIISEVDRRPEMLLSVVIPPKTAVAIWGEPEPAAKSLLVDTDVGAAHQVARQLPLALRPEAPEAFVVTPPPAPSQLKEEVSNDLTGLFLLLAAVSLVGGAFGIANTTLVSVMERVHEIGLRRSLGAQRHHVSVQFLTESALLGLLGGLAGTSLGVISVVIVSVVAKWTPVIEPWIIVAGPLVGAVTGLIAGAYPAAKAARVEPATALRS